MYLKSLAAALLLASAAPAMAETTQPIAIHDAYARIMGAAAKSGSAFMMIENHGSTDDRLIAAHSDIAQRTELHTHIAKDDGVMQMLEVPEGFAIPAGGHHALARGGDHVMFMGLTRQVAQGEPFDLTLTFEQAGEVTISLAVDLDRSDASTAHDDHDHDDHGDHDDH